MTDKYGFDGGISLPAPKKKIVTTPKARLDEAVKAGNEMGFLDRDPKRRSKPGPKRTEPQDKVSIPGPKRVIDDFRNFCNAENMTLWQGLEELLNRRS